MSKPAAINLTPDQEKRIIKEAVAELVQLLITQHKNEWDYISPAQAAGILDVNPKTLIGMKIPRYVLVVGKVVKYRLSEVMAFLQTTRES